MGIHLDSPQTTGLIPSIQGHENYSEVGGGASFFDHSFAKIEATKKTCNHG